MGKFNVKQVTEAGIITAGTVLGSMSSRVAAEKIPLKNKMAQHGIVAVLGISLAAFVKPNGTAGKALQGAGIGIAATQLNEVVKELVKPKDGSAMPDGVMKTAVGMGSPETIYVEPYYGNDYYHYEEVGATATDNTSPTFLSGANIFAEV